MSKFQLRGNCRFTWRLSRHDARTARNTDASHDRLTVSSRLKNQTYSRTGIIRDSWWQSQQTARSGREVGIHVSYVEGCGVQTLLSDRPKAAVNVGGSSDPSDKRWDSGSHRQRPLPSTTHEISLPVDAVMLVSSHTYIQIGLLNDSY